jgi:hypothetical protein
MISAVRKKAAQARNIQRRQKQMLRLMERYTHQIYNSSDWILPYVWLVSYLDMLPGSGGKLQEQEFVCHTNNIAFAAMIFEAQKITEGKIITIGKIEFKSLVEL